MKGGSEVADINAGKDRATPGGGSGVDVEKQLEPMNGTVSGVVITVSDRCAAGTRPDKSGPRAVAALAGHGVECPDPVVVTDDVEDIECAIQRALDAGVRLIFTTGGTGITPATTRLKPRNRSCTRGCRVSRRKFWGMA